MHWTGRWRLEKPQNVSCSILGLPWTNRLLIHLMVQHPISSHERSHRKNTRFFGTTSLELRKYQPSFLHPHGHTFIFSISFVRHHHGRYVIAVRLFATEDVHRDLPHCLCVALRYPAGLGPLLRVRQQRRPHPQTDSSNRRCVGLFNPT